MYLFSVLVSIVSALFVCHGALIGLAQNAPITECKFNDTKPVRIEPQKFVLTKNDTATNTTNTCVVAKFSPLIALNQTTTVNGTSTEKLVYLNLGNGTVLTQSLCNENTSLLAIRFECGEMHFTFVHNTTVSVEHIGGKFNNSNSTESFYADVSLFSTNPDMHYSCVSEQIVPLMVSHESNSTSNANLIISNVELEAFRTNSTSDNFMKPAQKCPLDEKQPNDLVPIAVGACLAALVVIVLIAYFVGRRRLSERSSYESV